MITSFQGEHRWLSNFWPSSVVLHNYYIAPTVEHAYQASKAELIVDMLAILKAKTPGMAKRMARNIQIRRGWNEVKEETMRGLVKQKFENPYMLESLLATGDQQIIEGNSWGDMYWGCVLVNTQWVGENRLGKIIMAIRDTYQNSNRD